MMRHRPLPIVRAWLRVPAVHFLALGAGLCVVATWTGAPARRPPIVITAARVAEIRDEYARSVHAVPTAVELDALVARDAEEEMLYREALALGLDRGDRAVAWRVIEKMHFLYGDAAGDDAQAYRRGMALGLERDDVVVRNAMITKIRLLARAASRSDEPTGPALERELAAYLQLHRDTYAQPTRLSLTQVFLSAAKRDAALDDDARTVLARLRATAPPPEAAAKLGDPFIAGSTFRATSPGGLAKMFGDAFVTAATALEPQRWSEPIRSPYGLHLVWVAARDAAEVPPLAAVRERVLRAYRAERRARYLAKMVDELRAAYEVRVEHGPQAL